MAKVRLRGDSSGFVELSAPDAASSNTLTLPSSNGTLGYPLTTDGNGVLSFALLTSSGLASGAVTPSKLSAGMVLKTQQFTDVGSTTSSTSYTNANASLFSFTPVSTNSTLILIASFQASIGLVAGFNTNSFHSLGESGSLIGAQYKQGAYSTTIGLGTESIGSIQTSLPNTSTSVRSFQMLHASSNASAAAGTQLIRLTVLEIAN